MVQVMRSKLSRTTLVPQQLKNAVTNSGMLDIEVGENVIRFDENVRQVSTARKIEPDLENRRD